MLHSEAYRRLTADLLGVADRHAGGRLVVIHEGGYAPAYAPYCGLAVLEELAGVRTAGGGPVPANLRGLRLPGIAAAPGGGHRRGRATAGGAVMTVRPQDLGGRRGFGPVPIEQDEPVFHADWEASVIAGILATISAGLYNVDQFREGIDELEPLSYLALGYYRRWLHTLEVNCVKSGVFSYEELERRIDEVAAGAGAAGRRPRRARRGHAEPHLPQRARAAIRGRPAGVRGRRRRARPRARGRAPRAHPRLRAGQARDRPRASGPRSPTPTRAAPDRASGPSTCTPWPSPGASCGPTPTRARRSSSTSGSRTSSRAEGAA